MMSEADAKLTTCFKTISPTTPDGKPCKARACQAWERFDWTIERCPHCGKDIRSQDDEPWGECRARYK